MTIPTHYDTRRGIRTWFGFGNYQYGDCTVAAVFHLIMVQAVAAASSWKKLIYRLGFRPPHDAFVVDEYVKFLATLNEKPSGSQGVDPTQFLTWMQAQGRIKNFARIPQTTDWASTIREATVQWDGCLVAMMLTRRAYFIGTNPGEWDLLAGDVPDPTLAHAVAAVEYSDNGNIGIVTWGQTKNITQAFANACVYGVWGFTS